MSNLTPMNAGNYAGEYSGDCTEEPGCGAILKVIRPREKDLGGFSVRRLLPVAGQQMVEPWIFFDHMGPAFFSGGYWHQCAAASAYQFGNCDLLVRR